MAKYKVQIKPSAIEEIEAISPKKQRQHIVSRISALADNPRPHGCEKLSGQKKYRIRQGMYRIVYSVEDSTLLVIVVKVGHRSSVYR